MQDGLKEMDLDWSDISAHQSEWREKWDTDYIDADSVVASE